jgi:hypothetical protein
MSKAEFKSPPIADFHATKFTWKAIRLCGIPGCTEIPEARDEAFRPTAINCHRPATVVPIGDESNRQCCRSGVRSLAQQSG